MPCRRGYLLYRPPGTGKSSLSLSITSHFNLDIYILNVSSVNSSSLSDLFTELPPQYILLLEDIDAVGMTQTRQVSVEESSQVAADPEKKTESKGRATLSELLNALDGVSSHEGRVLIITTNHKENLDPALIRARRADRKVELPYTDKVMITRIFHTIFKRSEDNVVPDPDKPAKDNETVERLANEFTGKVPEQEVSPAEIQSFLVENRDSPHVALENVQEWMTRVGKEKEMKRADSWGSLGAQVANLA